MLCTIPHCLSLSLVQTRLFFLRSLCPRISEVRNFLVHRRGLCSRVWHSKFVFFCLSSYAATNTSPIMGIYLIQLIYAFSVDQSVHLDQVKASNPGAWVQGLKTVWYEKQAGQNKNWPFNPLTRHCTIVTPLNMGDPRMWTIQSCYLLVAAPFAKLEL